MVSQALLKPPSSNEINAQLERIIASPEFRVPERGRCFLRYVVDETVAGRGGRLKAYGIALAVFARNDAFDAQNDPVVRIEAGRLRRALERYYLVAGPYDKVLIDIPKGGYRPTFTIRAPTLVAHAAAVTSLAAFGLWWERCNRVSWLEAAAPLAMGMLLVGVACLGAAPAKARLQARTVQQALAPVGPLSKHQASHKFVCRSSDR